MWKVDWCRTDGAERGKSVAEVKVRDVPALTEGGAVELMRNDVRPMESGVRTDRTLVSLEWELGWGGGGRHIY